MDDFSYSFKKLHPLCVNITKHCTVNDIKELKCALLEIDSSCLQRLQAYVVFPLRINLRKATQSDLIVESVKCMKVVFESSLVSTWSVFSDVFIQLFQLISSPNSIPKVNQICEELKIAIVECAEIMICQSTEDVLLQMFSESFCPALGHALFVLLQLLKHERSKSLQVAILRTVGALTYCCIDPKYSRDEKIRPVAGDILASFLPGISITLQDVICGDWKQGHVVIVSALHVLTEFITTTIGDCCINIQGREQSVGERNKNMFPLAVRDDIWVNETAIKLKVVVKNISTLMCHEHWKVRFALLKWAQAILCDCRKTLKNCTPIALEILFALSVDSYEQISLKSKETLKRYLNLLKEEDLTCLLTLLEENMYTLLSNLVKTIHVAHDLQTLAVLKIIHGYIQLFSSSVNNLLYSPSYLEKFIRCFVHLLEFDCSGICFFEEIDMPYNFSAGNFSVQNKWPKKSFKYFQDREIELSICSIFQLLGFYGDIRILIDYLLEQFIQVTDQRKQFVVLITNIVKGINANCMNPEIFIFENRNVEKSKQKSAKMTDNIQELLRDVLEEFLSCNDWKLRVSLYESRVSKIVADNTDLIESDISSGAYNDYISFICLLLESISSFAQVLGLNFVPLLIQVLCPLMEKAGSRCLLISYTSQVALNNISHYCGFNSVDKLILENSDYLVNSLSISLNNYIHNPEAPLVLQVALQICNADILPLIKDLIFKVLNILDYNQEKAFYLMDVLHAVVIAIQKWYPFNKHDNHLHHFHNLESKTFKNSFLDHHNLWQKEMNLLEENLNESVLVEKKGSLKKLENERNKSPLHVEIITQILQRCVHLQSFKNRKLCLLILDIIAASVMALKNYKDQLLPLIHNIWNSFALRFSCELVITMKAFNTFLVIADECGEFVKSRAIKDIWPNLLIFLNNQRDISIGKGNSSSYKFTNAYKFQLHLLSEFGQLCKKLDIQEKELEMVVTCCILYLNIKQPVLLQEAALKSLSFLTSVDKDAVWLYFNDIYSYFKEIHPPHQNLCAINMAGRCVKTHSDVDTLSNSLN